MASNLRAADILGIDWESRARNMQPRETPVEPRGVLSYWPGGTFRLEPAEAPRRNVLNDPDSWLNRGLSRLAGNAAEVILGRESGNSLVDLGAANVPGVGPAAILAAGGMPGLLDVAGAGDIKTILRGLKHGGKIGENTAKFILRNYDGDALRAVDEYVDRFPKVGNIQVPDAYKILSEGRSGEVYLSKEMPEHLQPAALATYSLPDIDWDERGKFALKRAIASGVDEKEATESVSRIVAEQKAAYAETIAHIREAAESGDFIGAIGASQALRELMERGYGEEFSALLKTINENGINSSYRLTEYINRLKNSAQGNRAPLVLKEGAPKETADFINAYNDYTMMQYGKAQPLEDIEAKQYRSEANKASKAAAKEARKAQAKPTASTVLKAAVTDADARQAKQAVDMAKIEADRARYLRNLEKRSEENRAITQAQQAAADERRAAGEAARPVMAEAAAEAPAGTTWRDTWDSGTHSVDYEGILGRRNLTEEEKRDAFVLDSLASHWANRLRQTRPVNGEWPGQASFRHNNLNYGMAPGKVGVADEFIKDVKHNVNTGNMPGVSFSLRRPAMVTNPAARSIVVDDYDIYYPLFHRKIDEKAKSIDSRYYYDPFDAKYQILNNPVK